MEMDNANKIGIVLVALYTFNYLASLKEKNHFDCESVIKSLPDDAVQLVTTYSSDPLQLITDIGAIDKDELSKLIDQWKEKMLN